MPRPLLTLLLLQTVTAAAFADQQSYYCAQHSGYINIGMTVDQVIAACGKPLSQQESDKPVMQKIPVQQVFFTGQSSSTAFYGVWAIPGGSSNYGMLEPFGTSNGGNGVRLQVDISNNKIKAAKIDGSEVNAFSICGGINISVGDPANKVFNNCGNPSIVNNTFTQVPVQSKEKPQIWVYQASQYQPAVSLTILGGKLISIQ